MINRIILTMKIITAKLSFALLVIVVAYWIYRTTRPESLIAPEEIAPAPADVIPPGIMVTESASGGSNQSTSSFSGDILLQGYASASSNPQQDIAQLSRVLSNFLLTHKNASDRPLSANEEWSATLLGKRPSSPAWLSENAPLFDEKKRLIDRWQSPLHFHAIGRQQWEVRSPGPDKILFTNDDLTDMIR